MYKEMLSPADILMLKCLPNVFEPFLQSTTTSKIFPDITLIILVWGFFS